jgi:hypothetical protein
MNDLSARRAAQRRNALLAAGIGVVAVAWFVLLSGWMEVVPGSVMVQRQNVLFNSDTNLWIDEMVNLHKPLTLAVHPLDVVFWRAPCQALYRVFRVWLPAEQAGLLAARSLVALVAGTGVAFLAFVALEAGTALATCVLLFAMYLLFTSSCTIALPEHFGISNGLLSIAFAVPLIAATPGVKTYALSALAVLAGGTTITNALYPVLSLLCFGFGSVRVRRVMLAIAAAALGVAVLLYADTRRYVLSNEGVLPKYVPATARLYLKTTVIHIYVTEFSNSRLIRFPGRAVVYAIYALAAPAVGPTPLIRQHPRYKMVSYEPSREPLRLSYYRGIAGLGAVLWLLLLFGCGYLAVADPGTRPFAWLAIGWVVFNMLFHNLWGDELILYAPHWSWALMGVVVLGGRCLPAKLTAALVIPIAICQVFTLVQIKSALETILH